MGPRKSTGMHGGEITKIDDTGDVTEVMVQWICPPDARKRSEHCNSVYLWESPATKDRITDFERKNKAAAAKSTAATTQGGRRLAERLLHYEYFYSSGAEGHPRYSN